MCDATNVPICLVQQYAADILTLNISEDLWLLLECLYHCSLVRVSWRHRQGLLAWAGGRKTQGMEGKATHFSCMTALATTTCRACRITSVSLLLLTFARPFLSCCHRCDFVRNVLFCFLVVLHLLLFY